MTARTYLYLPGHAGERLWAASLRGANAVIVDLEDAGAPAPRSAAITAVATWLAAVRRPRGRSVRLTSADEAADQLREPIGDGPYGVVIPKVAPSFLVSGADEAELLFAGSKVVLTSAAAGITPPVAAISPDYTDLDALRTTTLRVRRVGFADRTVIHLRPIPAVIGCSRHPMPRSRRRCGCWPRSALPCRAAAACPTGGCSTRQSCA